MTTKQLEEEKGGPWNPGIKSSLPTEYLPLSTLFRPENVFSSVEAANELSDFTGLPVQQLVFFRPERLIVHELLIRVSADIFVSDGSKYEDLGVNFRTVVDCILSNYIDPHKNIIINKYNKLKDKVKVVSEKELIENLNAKSTVDDEGQKRFGLSKLFRLNPGRKKTSSVESIESRDQRIISAWEERARSEVDPMLKALYASLVKVCSAIMTNHGRLMGDTSLLKSLVSGFTCNEYGSELVGELIKPYFEQAVEQEGYTLLPAQTEPVVINIKGASASGKSTMRPMQRQLTGKLGLNWQEFALISPDIWRKYLLDYDDLGPAYKYAGTLAGDEIPIIDKKLDRYISAKARQKRISHLLIDRFRFDSFAPGHDTEEGSNLLTRFGHTIYLTFMVTPPEATVERAWIRGLQVGRYKSVDDLLDHNIEAFKGMPLLFFTWVLRKDKKVYYEFLDNSVEKGREPVTIAFGTNNEMYLLDFQCMLDIVRYTKININASSLDEVYPAKSGMEATTNTDFLIKCAKKIQNIYFVDRGSWKIYAHMDSSTIRWIDPGYIDRLLSEEATGSAFQAMAPRFIGDLSLIQHQEAMPVPAKAGSHTMGVLN